MKTKWLLNILLMMIGTTASAQQKVVSRIVDITTGEPLSFASVYVNGSNSTISNVDGEFVVEVEETDSLRFSYLGYQTKWVCAKDIGTDVGLSNDDHMLNEVTVLATKLIIKNALKKLKKEYKENKKTQSNFFYRQMSFCDKTCTTFLESFFSGKSAIQLRDLSLVTGRYVSLASFETANPLNFYTFAQVSVFSSKSESRGYDQAVPICADYAYEFKTSTSTVNHNGEPVYKIDFKPKDPKRWSVEASVYIDASNFEILKYEGKGKNDEVWQEIGGIGNRFPIDNTFVVNYNHDKGYTEVSSVYFKTNLDYFGIKYKTTGMMYNVDDRFVKGQTNMDFKDDLLKKIEAQGVDRDFWRDKEIVKRTPLEQQVVELFEKKNLFGVY